MRKYYCMNPIAQVGLDNFSKNYIKTDEITEAEASWFEVHRCMIWSCRMDF